MKKRFLFPALAVLFLTLTRFQCGDKWDGPYPVRIYEDYAAQLDNRGIEPVILPSGAEGFLRAYGFEVFLTPTYVEPGDTVLIPPVVDGNTTYWLEPIATEFKILTVTEIPGAYPPGSDVSDLFRYIDRGEKPLEYKTMPEMATMSQNRIPGETPVLDFLLIHPPATEGWYQFQLVLNGADSIIASVTTQPIYLR